MPEGLPEWETDTVTEELPDFGGFVRVMPPEQFQEVTSPIVPRTSEERAARDIEQTQAAFPLTKPTERIEPLNWWQRFRMSPFAERLIGPPEIEQAQRVEPAWSPKLAAGQAAMFLPLPLGPETKMGKAALAYFGGQFLKEQPEQIREIREAAKTGDVSRLGRALAGEAMGAALLTGAAKEFSPKGSEKITASAYKNPQTGEVTTGPNHPEILEKLGKEVPPREERNTPDFGYQTTEREFVPRGEEAAQVAEASGQKIKEFETKPETGERMPHSDEIASPTEPAKPLGSSAAPEAVPIEKAGKGQVTKELPEVPKDHVRVFQGHGAAEGAGLGGSWFSVDEKYARNFAGDATQMAYVDIPKRYYEALRGQAKKQGRHPDHVILGQTWAKAAKPFTSAIRETAIEISEEPVAPKPEEAAKPEPSPAKPTGIKSKPYSEPDLARYREIYAREKELRTTKKFVTPEGDLTPEYEALQSEFEKLRNKYGGMPPAQGTGLPAAPTVEPAPEMAGMGGMAKGEELKPEMAQLTDALKTMAEGQKKPQMTKAYSLGETFEKAKAPVLKAVNGLKTASSYAKVKLTQPPEWNTFKSALGDRQLALTESVLNSRKFFDQALRAVPKPLDQAAISKWLDAGGDDGKLLEMSINVPTKFKPAYRQARKLTPEQKVLAQNIKNYFDARLQDAIDAGVLEEGVEDYIHRYYPAESNWKSGVLSQLRSGVFTGKPAFAKQRVFEFDYEAEQAGLNPEQSFIKRVAAYDLSLNKAIADRRFVKDMMAWKMKDGSPAVVPAGIGLKVGPRDMPDAFLIKPQVKGKQGMTADGRPYVLFDHPALRKWKWVGEGPDGAPALIQGNALVHPDALPQVKAVFGKSKFRQYPFIRAVQKVSSTVKQTMLDLSGFHMVQITVHGWEHRTFKPVAEIDLTNPDQSKLVRGGLQVADNRGSELFSEGLYGTSLTQHIPYFGQKLTAFKEYLFQDYIPRIKMAMSLHALERNRVRYSDDLKSGKMTEDQLYHLTANQGNAAFGELNYEMMGRNPTTQDALRLALLAPDFLEARGRFVGQAFTKHGAEQRTALLLGAGVLYITARILNKLIDGQYHFEPRNAFSVVNGKRAYSLRTVQGDVLHLLTNPRMFAYSRLNPLYGRTTFETLTGRDAFGRKRTPLEQLEDLAKTPIPISLRGLVDPREQKLWESFLNSLGITERRDTANDEIYRMAERFKKERGIGQPGEFIYDPEKDPYRRIKLALVFDSPESAAQEMKMVIDDKRVTRRELYQYFQRYGRTPFTGSKSNDRTFYASLSEDQKKTYQRAVDEREKLRRNVGVAQHILDKNFLSPATQDLPMQESQELPVWQ